MERERRSLWVIIIVLFLVGLFQLTGTGFSVSSWILNSNTGPWELDWTTYLWWILIGSPGTCAVVSALVYGWLHYRHRHLTLWLMALQMMIILMVAYYPLAGGGFLLVAWMILVSVIVRSKSRPTKEKRADILDDL